VILSVEYPVILSFCLIAAAKGSMNIAKRSGESGHPCLVPLNSVKLCDVSPLVVTVADGDVYTILIQLL